MKLIRQTVLVYREGNSDKVYEVDLCEVGVERYVVNFRYGRRGARLKEGVKTVSPVPLPDAEKVFQDLVTSKTRKGYREISARAEEPPVKRVVSGSADRDAHAQAVINRLRDHAGARKHGWPLERVIWRAGELKLREAAPLLVELIGSGIPLRDYCIAWALGWCGDARSVSALGRLYDDQATPDFVRRIAVEALLKLSDDEARSAFKLRALAELPHPLRGPGENGPSDAFAVALRDYLDGGDHRRYAVLDALYLIDNEHVRPALLQLLRQAPLRPNYFQRIRHIFKAAEYRRDAEVYGLIAYRFEKEKAMFGATYHPLTGKQSWSYVSLPGGGYVSEAHKEIRKEDAPIAYGGRTRAFLRQRVWRTLRRLGELGDAEEYVRMATGVLLPFNERDAQPVREAGVYQWQTGRTSTARWDAYAPYWAFNYILYANSPRYFRREGTAAWRCRASYKPGDGEPARARGSLPRTVGADSEGPAAPHLRKRLPPRPPFRRQGAPGLRTVQRRTRTRGALDDPRSPVRGDGALRLRAGQSAPPHGGAAITRSSSPSPTAPRRRRAPKRNAGSTRDANTSCVTATSPSRWSRVPGPTRASSRAGCCVRPRSRTRRRAHSSPGSSLT